jgi:hypothetical protein
VASAKNKRKTKVSNGERKSSKRVRLSEIDKVLMGKGILDRPVKVAKPEK